MTNRTDQISAAVQGVGLALDRVVIEAGRCLESARDRYEKAARHGWAGIAGTMELAVGTLESAVEQLLTAVQSVAVTAVVLDGIADRPSSPAVGSDLAIGLAELDSVISGTQAAVDLIDEALTHCQMVGLEPLPVALIVLTDEVAIVMADIAQVRDDMETERHASESFGQVFIAGQKGAWNQAVSRRPEPESEYVEKNTGYVFATDSSGRVAQVRGTLIDELGYRNAYQQLQVGRPDRRPSDDGGHFLATIFRGPGERINLTPMTPTSIEGPGSPWRAAGPSRCGTVSR